MSVEKKEVKYLGAARWFILGLTITSLLCCQQSEWKQFTSLDGNFTVLMPSLPTEKLMKINTNAGVVDLHIFYIENPDLLYLAVSYADYPKEAVKKENNQNILDGARDGCVSHIHGKLLSELIISLDNYPGREIKAEVPDGKHIFISRIYLIKNRLYSLALITSKNKIFTNDFSKKADKFFDSFKLLNR